MPAKNPKKCAHSHQHHSSAAQHQKKESINSISNLVSKSPSSGSVGNKNSKQAEPAFLTRCPHVCLSANFYLEDLNHNELLKLKSQRQEQLAIGNHHSSVEVTPDQMDTNESSVSLQSSACHQSQLACDECEQTKNLWLCLREGCMYVGCGGNSKDENSYKHSTSHAQNTFHPLAINLATRAIWCEFCNNKIVPDKNNPPFHFQSRKKANNPNRFNKHDTTPKQSISETRFDDLELISYLDQEHNRTNRLEKIFRLNKRPKFRQNSNFLFNYEDENDEDEEDEEDEEDGDRLNNYFMYDEDESKKAASYKNGQVGLDNLGNTCYMASAIQSLSNCAPMTGYFLECSDYIHMRILHKSNYFDSFSTANSNNGKSGSSTMLPCLSLSYMKLLRQLWEDTKKPGKGYLGSRRFSSYSPNEFVQVVKYLNPMFRGYMQHDSQEFLIYLMDQLHEELKRPVYTVQAVDGLLPSSSESEDDEASDESANENEITDKYRKTTSNSSIEVDSGIHRLSIKSSATQSSLGSIQTANTDGDNESADSFETAIVSGCQRTSSSHSDLSDNFLDAADDTIKQNQAGNSITKSQMKSKNKKRRKEKKVPNPVYSSAISDIFEGKLIGQVQCLECQHLSTTTESFMHLSLPIPTKEYLQSLQQRAIEREARMEGYGTGASGGHGQGWIGWMADIVKGYLWTQTIRLQDCLQAFFSDSDLRGDNMYSCEKCKKLTNGVKYSKVLELPEILIIHLKRFRHDSMFSTGKISSYVSFPLEDLEMRPYLHVSDTAKSSTENSRETQYELNSIICHYGSANGGHYIGYGRNYLNDEWYEYDDSYCKRVDSLTVQNLQAYVLFYKRKSSRIDHIKDQLRSQIISRTSLTLENSLLQSNYVSKQWLQKLKYFAEPGPIDNTDFLCRHNLVQPCFWANIDSLVLVCSTDTWLYLVKMFGIKRLKLEAEEESEDLQDISSSISEESDSTFGVCNYLYPCRQCQVDDELMKQRQIFEKNEFLRLTEKNRLTQMFHQNSSPNNPYKSLHQHQQSASGAAGIKLYAISAAWFKRWEQFVQFKHCPQKHQIPGPIANSAICNQQLLKSKIYQLNKNSNHYKLTEEVWEFLHDIYGGGPTLQVNGPSGARQSLRTMSTSSTSSMK